MAAIKTQRPRRIKVKRYGVVKADGWGYHVVNNDSGNIQSVWRRFTDAKEAADRLNKWVNSTNNTGD